MSESSTAEPAGRPADQPAQPGAAPSREEILADWVAELSKELQIDDVDIDIDRFLSLAGEAAHAVVRPAAPLTTLVVGLAAGLAAGSGQATEQTALTAAAGVARRLCRARTGGAADETARDGGGSDATEGRS